MIDCDFFLFGRKQTGENKPTKERIVSFTQAITIPSSVNWSRSQGRALHLEYWNISVLNMVAGRRAMNFESFHLRGQQWWKWEKISTPTGLLWYVSLFRNSNMAAIYDVTRSRLYYHNMNVSHLKPLERHSRLLICDLKYWLWKKNSEIIFSVEIRLPAQNQFFLNENKVVSFFNWIA